MRDSQKRELVSIVIPTYNSEKVIKSCVVTLMNQTYSDLEIIIVDDGSTDGTVTICREYQMRDDRIKVLCKEHAGVSKARNAGMEAATGRYITFVDSDDFVEENLIEEEVSAFLHFKELGTEIAWVMCGMHVDVYCGTMEEGDNLIETEEKLSALERNKIGYLSWLKLFNFITNKLYELEKIREHGICFAENIQIGEDLQFNLDYLNAVDGKLGMVNRPLYHYVRCNDESLSLRYYENAIEHTKAVYRSLLDFAGRQEGITEDDLLIIKSVYIVDWTSRLTALFESTKTSFINSGIRKRIRREIVSEEFCELLEEVHKCHKISYVRYLMLKCKNYGLYCFVRRIYRLIK